MMEVDLEASDLIVGRSVAEHCSRFGQVTSVKVHREPSAFALVEMTTREQTSELAVTYGGSAFGNCVLIHLRQQTA